MIRVTELNRRDFLDADEAGTIDAMPDVHYYGQRMFSVDAPSGTGRAQITDAVFRFADPKAYANSADKKRG